jgi:conjugative transfer region protein TrbK
MARILTVALLGAFALMLAIMSTLLPCAPGAAVSHLSPVDAPPPKKDVPARCRVAAEADPVCAAAWEAKRRRFFRQQDEMK